MPPPDSAHPGATGPRMLRPVIDDSLFLRACRGQTTDRTPMWIMRQAGRYLPEYRAVREKVSFLELCRTPELCAEVTCQPIRRYGFDAAILFSDILTVLDAMGLEVEFNPAPFVPNPVRDAAALDRLVFGDIAPVTYVFDAVRACRAALPPEVPLIGFCGAPLTTASYMIEGKGSKDFRYTKSLMFTEPALFGRLMENLTGLLITYLREQARAGANALQIFDSWATALTPADYRAHVLPHLQRMVDELRDLDVPLILFARGNAGLLGMVAELGADVIGVDWSIGLGDAIEAVGSNRVVQGNLDPLCLTAPHEVLRARAREVLEAGANAKGHIFNLGHGITPYIDPEAVAVLRDEVASFRRAPATG